MAARAFAFHQLNLPEIVPFTSVECALAVAACRLACWRSAESGEQTGGSRGSCRGGFVRIGLIGLGAISSVGLPLARPAVGCSTVEVAAVTVVVVLK